tara:strand:- start:728 stop:1759 length:1032 start_codon:yes stop_codon:yes gene_type:complete
MAKFLGEHSFDETFDLRQRKSVFIIAALTTTFASPFVLITFLQGRVVAAFLAIVVLLLYIFTALQIPDKNRVNFQLNAILLTCIISVLFCISIFEQGYLAILWSFPAVTTLYIILPLRLSLPSNTLLFLSVVTSTVIALDLATAVRVASTLLIVNMSCVIFVSWAKQQQKDLSLLAETDALTGVFNRLKMNEKLNSMILEARVEKVPLTLLALDLDHFKKINDEKGHDVGDQVLSVFGHLLTNCCRESDLIFRTGGEEFIVSMLRADAETSRKVAVRIQESLAKTEIVPGLKVTTSIGIATLAPHEILEELLKRCDDYLYQAKDEGRNRIIENIQAIPANRAE